MSAEKNPESPKEPKEIRDFREKYNAALDRARISEEHTATEGWGNLYREQRDRVQRERADLAAGLGTIAEAVKHRFLMEEEEKALGELKKSIAALRETDGAFHRDVIDPVIAPLRECDAIIQSALSDAQNAERSAPLHTRGLADAMDTVIGTMPRVKFIMSSGRLTIG